MQMHERIRKAELLRVNPKVHGFQVHDMPITPKALEKVLAFPHAYDDILRMHKPTKEVIPNEKVFGAVSDAFSSVRFGGIYGAINREIEHYAFLSRLRDENFVSDVYLGDNQKSNTGGFTLITAENVSRAGENLAKLNRVVCGWSHRHPISHPSGTDSDNDDTMASAILTHNHARFFKDTRFDELATEFDKERNLFVLSDNYFEQKFELSADNLFALGLVEAKKLESLAPADIKKVFSRINFLKGTDYVYGYSLIITPGEIFYPEIFYGEVITDAESKKDKRAVFSIKAEKVGIQIIDLDPKDDIHFTREQIAAETVNKIFFHDSMTLEQILVNLAEQKYDTNAVQAGLWPETTRRYEELVQGLVEKRERKWFKPAIPLEPKKPLEPTVVAAPKPEVAAPVAQQKLADEQTPYMVIEERLKDISYSVEKMFGDTTGRDNVMKYSALERIVPHLKKAYAQAAETTALMKGKQELADKLQRKGVERSDFVYCYGEMDKLERLIAEEATVGGIENLGPIVKFRELYQELAEIQKGVPKPSRLYQTFLKLWRIFFGEVQDG